MTLTLNRRAAKGDALTQADYDRNFDKIEAAALSRSVLAADIQTGDILE